MTIFLTALSGLFILIALIQSRTIANLRRLNRRDYSNVAVCRERVERFLHRARGIREAVSSADLKQALHRADLLVTDIQILRDVIDPCMVSRVDPYERERAELSAALARPANGEGD